MDCIAQGNINRTQVKHMRAIKGGGKRTKGGAIKQHKTQVEKAFISKQEIK